ncbi:hypothetical protein M404DRAFT_125261, partial [Pisolithus tinctorius Marx 270]
KLADWERFPNSLEQMGLWATVVTDPKNSNPCHNNMLVYKSPPCDSPGALFPISVQLFGFIQSFQIGRYGNWRR